ARSTARISHAASAVCHPQNGHSHRRSPMRRPVSVTSANASPTRCCASRYNPERATNSGTLSALVCASAALTASLIRPFSCSVSPVRPTPPPVAPPPNHPPPTATPPRAHPPPPPASAGTVPGPVVGSTSPLLSAGGAQDQPEKQRRHSSRGHSPQHARRLGDH